MVHHPEPLLNTHVSTTLPSRRTHCKMLVYAYFYLLNVPWVLLIGKSKFTCRCWFVSRGENARICSIEHVWRKGGACASEHHWPLDSIQQSLFLWLLNIHLYTPFIYSKSSKQQSNNQVLLINIIFPGEGRYIYSFYIEYISCWVSL